jgi:membrane protein DedA with SNARE-associated domain
MENIFQSDFLNSIADFIISNPVIGFFLLGLIFVLRNETAILMSTVFVLQGHLTWTAVWIISIASVVFWDNVCYWAGWIIKETRFNELIERKLKFLPGFREYLKRHFKKIIMVVEYSVGLT